MAARSPVPVPVPTSEILARQAITGLLRIGVEGPSYGFAVPVPRVVGRSGADTS